MRIELHPEADAEFAAQIDFYEAQQPGLGQGFYDEVIASLDWIAANPTLCRLRKNYHRVNLFFRSISPISSVMTWSGSWL